jgi:hypothetical protein
VSAPSTLADICAARMSIVPTIGNISRICRRGC